MDWEHANNEYLGGRKMPAASEDIRISTDPNDIDLDAYDRIWTSIGYSLKGKESYSDGFISCLFGPGAYGFFAFAGDRLIGFIRILSDDLTCAWIGELCIHKAWREQGVGSALMEAVNRRFAHIELQAHAISPSETYYERLGIGQYSGLVAWARRGLPPEVSENLGQKTTKLAGLEISIDHNDVDFDAIADLYLSTGCMRIPLKKANL